ncbi:hypothetical protein ACET3Z_003011 [Daucus carota]
MRSLKLGVEEEAAIRVLTGDNLHHCSLLISEASLQLHGLSDLGPEAQVALGSIFRKRETAASQAVVTEVPREKKSRKRGKSPVIEKVPAFLTPREVTIEEDSSPYVVEWGLLKKDTVVGDSRAAAEWSRNVITPRDRAHVVESSEDLQIELLGAQAVATVNTYLQAAVHNLKAVRAEKAIAERDRDRYFEASTANFEQYRKVEAELVAEQEKVRTLEAELARVKREAIADYKASKEFEDLLVAEYDASFPETFKSCWERIVEELGAQIEGVTLERFPVPKLPGEEASSPMEVENLGDSHPDDSQGEEIPSEELAIVDPSKAAEDIGSKTQEAQAQDTVAQDEEAKEREEAQEDLFDDGLP